MSTAEQKNATTELPAWVAAQYTNFEQSLNGAKAKPTHAIRKHAFSSLLKSAWPSVSQEEWKYTSLNVLQNANLRLAAPQAMPANPLEVFDLPAIQSIKLVCVDGVVQKIPEQLPAGLRIESLAQVFEQSNMQALTGFGVSMRQDKHALAAMNTAFARDGVVITVASKAVITQPIEIVFLNTQADTIRFPRVLIKAESQAQCSVIEYHIGSATGFTCAVTEIQAEENATIKHYRYQNESTEAVHVGLIGLGLSKTSHVSTTALTFGAGLVRNEVHGALGGEQVDCNLFGLTVANGSQHVDNTTVLDHQLPHGQSRENYKGIYSDKSRGVFSGTIIVRQDAQKTNAFQSNRSVLLSPDARVDTRPQLKIWADDVKCTHGATVGQLDEAALFYALSRGINKKDAEKMLVTAFAEEVLGEIPYAELKDFVKKQIDNKLQ